MTLRAPSEDIHPPVLAGGLAARVGQGARHPMPHRSVSRRLHLFPGALPLAAALLLIGTLGPNLWLASVAIAVLLFGGSLLWRPGETPILLLIFAVQWLQASISIFHASWLGVSVNDLQWFGGDVSMAILLSLIALACLAAGMRLGAGAQREEDAALAQVAAQRYDVFDWFRLYLMAFAASIVLHWASAFSAGLSQPLLALSNLKWAFFWILAFATFVNAQALRRYFAIAFLIELGFSVGGYSSGFKTVLLVSAVAVVAARMRVSRRGWLALVLAAMALLATGIVWTAVKPQFRTYISGGSNAQVVTVDYGARVLRLVDLVLTRDMDDFSEATQGLLDRLSYVHYFGGVLQTVPAALPHENGALWFDAVARPFMPRLFFPDKAPISDSTRTNKYSGVRVAGDDEGTSISIGYVGESYIDFGAVGMMVPIAALGLMIGLGYRWLLRGDRSQVLLGMGLATAIGINVIYLETSITKMFGALIVAFIGAGFVLLFVAPRYLRWTRLPIRRLVRR